MPEWGDVEPAGGNEFESRLQEMKERGCTVLVTGDTSSDVHVGICRRLLGDESKHRRRLLVSTNGTSGLDSRLPAGGLGSDDTEVIVASATRSAVAQTASPRGIDVVDLEDATPVDLGFAIVDAFEALEARHDPPEPAELRFGLDSLSPLLDAHGEQVVFEFLALVTRYVQANDALGHVHLPVERESYVARLLAPLFDAVVEVRVMDGQRQQRWHLDDGAVTSRWLSI